MRITTKIVSSGECWHPYFPRINLAACYPKCEDGSTAFDEDEFRRQIRDQAAVQMSDRDYGTVCAFAAILIESLNDWLDDNDTFDGEDKAKEKKLIARFDRKLVKGVVTYCRTDITAATVQHQGRILRVPKIKITFTDMEVVEKHHYEEDWAMIVADFCNVYSKKYVAAGDPPLVFTPETQKIIADLHDLTEADRRRKEIIMKNKGRFACPNYKCGFCSPPNFKCEHQCNGKCVEIKEGGAK